MAVIVYNEETHTYSVESARERTERRKARYQSKNRGRELRVQDRANRRSSGALAKAIGAISDDRSGARSTKETLRVLKNEDKADRRKYGAMAKILANNENARKYALESGKDKRRTGVTAKILADRRDARSAKTELGKKKLEMMRDILNK